uniref:NAD(P)(+)--arginine ADP-ribosyltransferase n=1 Tax=Anolis carolinensis TaxID=28377 RepID=A0A803TKQ6_ANOCA
MLPLLTFLVLVLCLTDIPLTMAPNSYDDQYIGCPSTMEDKLMDPTKNEFAPGKKYTYIWENAVSFWNQSKGSVLLNLYPDFNAAVRTGGKSTTSYEKDFHFKSFDFLVTKAIEVLKASQTGCYDVYRGVSNLRFTVPDPNKPVRFGHFTSSSLSKEVAEYFGTDTFFTIKTCYGAKIIDFSYFPSEEEVLIPPYETFKVVGVKEVGGKTQITLHSDSKSSNFNCGSKRGKMTKFPCSPHLNSSVFPLPVVNHLWTGKRNGSLSLF